jgi:hypothetical protein
MTSVECRNPKEIRNWEPQAGGKVAVAGKALETALSFFGMILPSYEPARKLASL